MYLSLRLPGAMEGRDPLHKQDEYGIVVDQGEAGIDEDQHGIMPDGFEGIADADLEEYLLPVPVEAVKVEDDLLLLKY